MYTSNFYKNNINIISVDIDIFLVIILLVQQRNIIPFVSLLPHVFDLSN